MCAEIIQYTFDETNAKSICGETEGFTKLKVKVKVSGRDIDSGSVFVGFTKCNVSVHDVYWKVTLNFGVRRRRKND